MNNLILHLFEAAGVEYRLPGEHHHATTGRIQFDCPKCSPGTNSFRAGWHVGRGQANCWACGRLDPVQVLTDTLGVPLAKAVDLVKAGRTITVDNPVHNRLPFELPRHMTADPPGVHRNYLEGRGFDAAALTAEWGLQYVDCRTHLRWRIFIPIHYNGQIVSWTTRTVQPAVEPRYMSCPGDREIVPHKTLLYGEPTGRVVLVVEGPFDVWRFGRGAGATFGTAYTPAQVFAIGQFPHRVICYDTDQAGVTAGKRLAAELAVFPGRTTRIELDAADVASAPKKEIKKIREFFFT